MSSVYQKFTNYHNSKFIEFVKQDTRSIFKDKPILRKFVNTLTDVAGRSEILFNGGKLLYNTNNMNTITLNLTNAQIDRLMKKQNFRVNKTQIVGMDDEQCNCHLEVDPLIYQNSRKKTGAGFLVPTQGGRINVLRAVKRFAKNKIVRAIAKNKTVRAVAKSKIAKKVGKTGINLVLGQLNNAGLISDNQENQLQDIGDDVINSRITRAKRKSINLINGSSVKGSDAAKAKMAALRAMRKCQSNINNVNGGKINFKKIGRTLKKVTKATGRTIKKVAKTTGAIGKDLGDFGLDIAKTAADPTTLALASNPATIGLAAAKFNKDLLKTKHGQQALGLYGIKKPANKIIELGDNLEKIAPTFNTQSGGNIRKQKSQGRGPNALWNKIPKTIEGRGFLTP